MDRGQLEDKNGTPISVLGKSSQGPKDPSI